jgi:hypothetical protein
MKRLPFVGSLRLHALHWLARVALRVRSPLEAKAVVDRIARRFPPLDGVEGARAAMRQLFPAGSCLSRALTIAAMLPGTEVVLGVDPWRAARVTGHAWLEIDSVRIDTNPAPSAYPLGELARLGPTWRTPRSDARASRSLKGRFAEENHEKSYKY